MNFVKYKNCKGDYVRLLPLPVVGGYLGYIGYFCLVAGLSVTTGEQISGPDTYYRLFNEAYIWKLIVCAVMTFSMWYTAEKYDDKIKILFVIQMRFELAIARPMLFDWHLKMEPDMDLDLSSPIIDAKA